MDKNASHRTYLKFPSPPWSMLTNVLLSQRTLQWTNTLSRFITFAFNSKQLLASGSTTTILAEGKKWANTIVATPIFPPASRMLQNNIPVIRRGVFHGINLKCANYTWYEIHQIFTFRQEAARSEGTCEAATAPIPWAFLNNLAKHPLRPDDLMCQGEIKNFAGNSHVACMGSLQSPKCITKTYNTKADGSTETSMKPSSLQ